MIALRGAIHVACFHHSCFVKGVWRCLTEDVDVWKHATLLFCALGGVKTKAWEKESRTMKNAITVSINDIYDAGQTTQGNDVKIVLFPHHGDEYDPKMAIPAGRSAHCSWNLGEHRRRLLRSAGKYVDSNGNVLNGDLAFWSEWEAETIVTKLPSVMGIHLHPMAKWIHEPQPPQPIRPYLYDGKCCMNTDPCVFGDTFKYALCKQVQFHLTLQHLPAGSLIFFGATRKDANGTERFYLDTLFVVNSRTPYIGPDTAHKVQCSTQYRILTLNQTPAGEQLAFYRGANQPDAAFSFTPARIYDGPNGRCRQRCPLDFPVLNAKLSSLGVVYRGGSAFFNEKKKTGVSAVSVAPSVANAIWQEALTLVYQQNFLAGIRFDWPRITQVLTGQK